MLKPGFDIDGRPLTIAAAKKEINRIRGDRGHIDANDEDQIGRTDIDFQEDYRRRALLHRDVYARYTKTVAEQLYSSRFRLIHELLQNADDASYAETVDPEITFRIKPTELIVESNERGFSLKDVEAICDTGKSSKAGDTDTTGEKGLGFKSVFGIADCVHIQSGIWSFRFEHRRGDDGVGMITPIWTDAEADLPSAVGTRCRLQFSDTRDTFSKRLVSEFERLPNTIIFALRQLGKLVVVLESVNGRSDQITFTKHGNINCEEMLIDTRVTGRFGELESTTTRLRLFQKSIDDLPFEDLRTTDTSTITIAFEVDTKGLPVISPRGQHVFAYLPVQRLPQLPFLIQADFVLAANREAVPDSDWNQALREGVAATFCAAAEKFTAPGDSLEYKWMHYLPVQHIEGFWEELYEEIKDHLRSRKILRSRRGRLQQLRIVRELPSWFLHEQKPLVPDNDEDIYLSPKYKAADIGLLKSLGLKQIAAQEIVARLKLSLSSGNNPIRERPLDDRWHTAFAAFAGKLLQDKAIKNDIQQLEIIPLNDKSWVSPSSMDYNPVYFPYVVDEDSVRIELPEGLGLRKLHPTAFADGERVSFYISLGISTCSHETAIRKILGAHKAGKRGGNVYGFVRDLEILFWFGRPTGFGGFSDFGSVPTTHADLWIVSDQNNLRRGRSLFFPSDEEYNAQKLLAATPSIDFIEFGFLHQLYLKSPVQSKIRHQSDWLSWLRKCGILYFPPLIKQTLVGFVLSPAMKLIARDSPDKFVANLKEHWPDYRLDSAKVAKDLGSLPVPCQDGTKQPLSTTILPTQQLLEKSRQLKIEPRLPFLKLPSQSDIQRLESWSFLGDFGVTCDVNAAFYLAALRLLNTSTEEHLVSICTLIYAGIVECTKVGDAKALQEVFASQPLVHTRAFFEGWRKSADCVWEGPEFLCKTKVLFPVYGADSNASTFFKTFLNMRNADHKDVIDELEMLSEVWRSGVPQSVEKDLPVIYASLADMARSDAVVDFMREKFNARGLIKAKGRWLRPSECIWNCAVEISGRVPLEQTYPELKKFFVDKMRVTIMNVNVLAQELTKIAKKATPDVDEVKRIMLAIGQSLAADPTAKVNEGHLNSLRQTAFLPVRDPQGQQLLSTNGSFCINDHKRYGEAFSNKARILDFDYEDLTSLHPLFEVLEIEHRYISNLVSAHTTVESSCLSDYLTSHIRDRAYAFSCCANAHNSPKYYNQETSMHRLLLTAEVFVCEKMWTELMVRQAEGNVSVKSDRAVVKLEQVGAALHVFVPGDSDGLYSCFHTELPGELTRILGIEDRGAAKTIYRILNDQAKDLDTIMEDEDLPDYPWIEKPPPSHRPVQVPNPLGGEPAGSDAVMSEAVPDREPAGSDAVESEAVPDRENAPSVLVTTANAAGQYAEAQVLPTRIVGPGAQVPVWQQVARTEQYKKLLKEVMRQARRVRHASTEPLTLAEIDDALNELGGTPDYAGFHQSFGGAAYGSFEENARVGAAGELFVFERLKALGISNLTIDNWQSSIRHYVGVLHEYENEARWSGREISDIMYSGRCLRLQDFLRQNTSHPYPPWLDSDVAPHHPVQYHIEVKTTSGPCSTPFFMSKNQYKLMRQKACDPHLPTAPTDIFVIVRVFNLFSSRIAVQVYINPWHLKESVLEFVADPWKVVPSETAAAVSANHQ